MADNKYTLLKNDHLDGDILYSARVAGMYGGTELTTGGSSYQISWSYGGRSGVITLAKRESILQCLTVLPYLPWDYIEEDERTVNGVVYRLLCILHCSSVTVNGVTQATAYEKGNDEYSINLNSLANYVIPVYVRQVKVQFVGADGSVLKTQYVPSGGSAVPPSVTTPTGKVFEGWSGSYQNVTSDSTVYATFRDLAYSVQFDGNGATGGSTASQVFTYGVAQSLSANGFSRSFAVVFDYGGNGQSNGRASSSSAFLGWATTAGGAKVYSDGQSVSNLSTTDGAIVTLYAKWGAASAVTLPSPTVPGGRRFLGWYTASSGGTLVGAANASYTPSGSVTLYARWAASAYTIRYNANGGTGTMSDTPMVYGTAKSLAANAFTKTGHAFAGWATTAGGAKVYSDGQSVNSLSATDGAVVTLYAVWTPNAYTVTFVPGSGNSVATSSKQVTFGQTYGTLPTPTSGTVGMFFTGWYTASSGGTRIDAGTKVSTAANHSLYARFVTGTYTVRFDGNGATSGTMANQSFRFGESKALSANAYARRHTTLGYDYGFLGWAKSASATRADYADGQSVSNLATENGGTVVLYAVWRGKVKVTVRSNDTSLGTVNSSASGYYFSDDSVSVTATVVNAATTRFTGWFLDGAKVSASAKYALTVPAKDCVVEANFRNVQHFIQIPSFGADKGTVSLTVAGRAVEDLSAPVSCLEGDTVGLKAVPAYNYDVTGWEIDGESFEGDERTFVVGEAHPKTIVCLPQFEEKPKYALTVSADGRGGGAASVSVSDAYGHTWEGAPGEAVSVQAYVRVKYTATVSLPPDDSTLRFDGWYLDGSAVETTKKTYSVERTDETDVSLVASVYSAKHTLNIAPNRVGYGYVEAKVGETRLESLTGAVVVDGQYVTVAATASRLRLFSRWEVDGRDDEISREFRFQVSPEMPATITATAVFESRSRSAFNVTKENGSLGSIDVFYEDVLDPVTGDVGPLEVYLTKDARGEVHDYQYAGVEYVLSASLAESLSEAGNPLTRFDGWYAKSGGEWERLTGDLTRRVADTPDVKAVFASNALYEGTLTTSGGQGSVEVSDDTPPDVSASGGAGPKWLDGRLVRLTASPAAGYALNFWRVTIGGVTQNAEKGETYEFTPTADFTAEAVFERKRCPVTLSVDAASARAAESVAAEVEGATVEDLAALVYGMVVTFRAAAKDGYSFEGWYVGGEKASPDAVYTPPALSDALAVTAKFAATVTLGVSTSASASGAVAATATVDSDGNPGGWPEPAASATCKVVLGGKCGIRVTATSGAFSAWFAESDGEFAAPLDLEAEDVIEVTDNVSLVARLISDDDYTYIALFNEWKDETERDDGVTLGILSMTKGEAVSEADYNAGLAKAGYTGASLTGAYAYYRFLGTRRSRLSAVDNSGRSFAGWQMKTLSGGAFGEPTTYPLTQDADVFTNRHAVYTAFWGTPKPVRIEVAFCDGSRGLGELSMSGETDRRIVADSGIVDEIMQGVEVSVGSSVANGYMFGGWYADRFGKILVSRDQAYSFVVRTQVTLYARFVEDRNAIYLWEGGKALKTLRWRSKVYVSNRPFDASCARIDAAAYSVGLTVEAFSSPDQAADAESPRAVKRVEIRSQGARRLPKGRPEKFCTVAVESDGEVDMVAVGTSMEGVAV